MTSKTQNYLKCHLKLSEFVQVQLIQIWWTFTLLDPLGLIPGSVLLRMSKGMERPAGKHSSRDETIPSCFKRQLDIRVLSSLQL